jgi:hypothetical protein
MGFKGKLYSFFGFYFHDHIWTTGLWFVGGLNDKIFIYETIYIYIYA